MEIVYLKDNIMTPEEKDRIKADVIRELTGIDAYKTITSMTVLELYDLIKLAVNRKQQDY